MGFSQWKLNNGKAYNAELNERKFATWLMNRDFVVAHNTRYLSGEETFTVEMNKFADLNESEFANQVLMQPIEGPQPTDCTAMPQMVGDNPTAVDWRTKGYVTPIKNQGQCGSCWPSPPLAPPRAPTS